MQYLNIRGISNAAVLIVTSTWYTDRYYKNLSTCFHQMTRSSCGRQVCRSRCVICSSVAHGQCRAAVEICGRCKRRRRCHRTILIQATIVIVIEKRSFSPFSSLKYLELPTLGISNKVRKELQIWKGLESCELVPGWKQLHCYEVLDFLERDRID